MKTSLLALVASLLTTAALAQSSAYFELGGNGLLYSFNYERRFTERLAGRIGMAFLGSEDSDGEEDWAVAAPVMVQWISSPQSNHHFETGIGIGAIMGEGSGFYSDVDEDFSGLFGTATAGYRYQRPTGGFVFRAGLTPIFDLEGLAPWAGVSFGYAWGSGSSRRSFQR